MFRGFGEVFIKNQDGDSRLENGFPGYLRPITCWATREKDSAVTVLIRKSIRSVLAVFASIRMLLNHTNGIPSYKDDPWFLLRYFGWTECEDV